LVTRAKDAPVWQSSSIILGKMIALALLGMEMAAEMFAKIRDEKLCDGVHVMAIGAEKNVPTILDLAGVTM